MSSPEPAGRGLNNQGCSTPKPPSVLPRAGPVRAARRCWRDVNVGWHQVAFRRDVQEALTPVDVGAHRLMLIDDGGRLGAYDATCPHRGAHLARGGSLDDGVVVCPFHGRRVGLGLDSPPPYCVAAHPTCDYGGAIFVLPRGARDTGLPDYLASLAETHCFVPTFTLDAPVPPQIVIENVFDTDHFTAVHGISRRPSLSVGAGVRGRLEVEAEFETVAPRLWGGERDAAATMVRTHFHANVFSPGLVATELGDEERPHVVITAATARPHRGCTIRVTLAVWDDGEPGSPDRAAVMGLATDSRLAFEQDMAIWQHLDVHAANHLDDADAPVRAFRQFCATFAT
jgi:3-ketosteroid 9alpha-monooxygenase subunit A